MNFPFNPELLIPLVGTIFGTAMVVAIVGIVTWHRARDKELQFHQDLRIREMEHQRKMKELEVEMERIKARSIPGQAA
jgi:hypothetical protein